MVFSIATALFILGLSLPALGEGLEPPLHLASGDTPSDSGKSITLEWTLSPSDLGQPSFRYEVFRSTSSDTGFSIIASVPGGTTGYLDADSGQGSRIENGRPYYYRVRASDGVSFSSAAVAGPASASADWYDAGRTNLLVFIAVFFVLVLVFIQRAGRGVALHVRKIPGLEAIEEAVGRATEMGKSVLYVPGIDDVNNIQTIYSMVILGNVARIVAKYGTPLIVPVCRAFVVPLAEETVKQGYLDAGHPEAYNPNNIRYLSDEQFAFTAGVDGIMLREKPAANLFLGSFFAESLILAETGFSTGAIQIAGTANIHQLPFFVVACDYTLIGEEFFAASAYLSRDPRLLGTLVGSDWMKVLLVGLLLTGALLETFGVTSLTQWLVTQ
ncbi:MAG: fibronectin type III domain-containing protein [Candidatus Eisenbacteria bacterium]